MQKKSAYLVIGIFILLVIVAFLFTPSMPNLSTEDTLALYREDAQYSNLNIRYPLNETLFPPEIIPPTFRWEDADSKSDTWLISIKFQDTQGSMNFTTREKTWSPDMQDWETIKKQSLQKQALVTILGINSSSRQKIHTRRHEVI